MIKLSKCKGDEIVTWCKSFRNSKKSEMDEDISNIFISLTLNEMKGSVVIPPEIKEQFLYHIIQSRLRIYDFELTDSAIAFLSLVLRTPGEITMMLTYIQYECHLHSTSKVDIQFLALHVIPWGLPTDSEFLRLWDEQKCDGMPDNLLDHIEYLKPIRLTNSN